MDLITCVITTYKRPTSILKRALESIVSQTYKNIELIVVNDSPESTELAKDIQILLKSYLDISIRYIEHAKNMGACQARNTAITAAKGKYIAFLDDDDEWLATKLEKQYALINQSDDIGFVFCSHFEIDASGKRIIYEELAREGSNSDDFERLLKENYVGSTSYPLIRLDYIKELGGFNTELQASQDYEMWLRIAQKYKILYCKNPLVNYYHSDESISSSMDRKLQGYNYLLNEFGDIYLLNKYLYNYRLNYLAFVCLKNRSWKKMFHFWGKAIKVKWISESNFLILHKFLLRIAKKKKDN